MCVRSPILIRMYGVLMEHPKFLRPHFISAYSSRKQAEKLKEKTETMIMEGNQKVEMLQGVNVKMEKAKIHVIEMDIPFAPGAKRFLF
jgi:hypothetical protein